MGAASREEETRLRANHNHVVKRKATKRSQSCVEEDEVRKLSNEVRRANAEYEVGRQAPSMSYLGLLSFLRFLHLSFYI